MVSECKLRCKCKHCCPQVLQKCLFYTQWMRAGHWKALINFVSSLHECQCNSSSIVVSLCVFPFPPVSAVSLISLTLLLSDTHWLALPLFPSLNVASSFPAAPVTSWPGGERGQKRPLVLCLEQASLLTHTHTLAHTHITQGRLVRRGLPWRQDQGEKEGKRRDGWSRGEMDDSQGLIFVSKCLLAFEVVAPFFFFFFPPTPIAGGREVRIDLQLFHLLLYHMFKQMLAFHIWEG